jgi:hypothetical protein
MSILKDADVQYFPDFLTKDQANKYFNEFNEYDFKYNSYKGHTLNRQTLVFILNEELRSAIPAIWGTDVSVELFSKSLIELRDKIAELNPGLSPGSSEYNVALCNRYPSGKDYIGYHSDNEEFGSTNSIASISLGHPRKFTFKSKTTSGDSVSLTLNNGSLLYMGNNCQENYLHGMVKESGADCRINVTFRIWKPDYK